MKEEVERRQNADVTGFFDACRRGDAEHVRRRLDSDPQLAHATLPNAPHAGWTALHTAARAGHDEVLNVLLAHGAVVDAREAGDNTTALHWAAARADVPLVRTLLDEPYLSTDERHEGLILHSVYHRPNGWDYIPPGQTVPCGESCMWGDYHARELMLYITKQINKESYYTFYDVV